MSMEGFVGSVMSIRIIPAGGVKFQGAIIVSRDLRAKVTGMAALAPESRTYRFRSAPVLREGYSGVAR